jgi:hypothetical protein
MIYQSCLTIDVNSKIYDLTVILTIVVKSNIYDLTVMFNH